MYRTMAENDIDLSFCFPALWYSTLGLALMLSPSLSCQRASTTAPYLALDTMPWRLSTPVDCSTVTASIASEEPRTPRANPRWTRRLCLETFIFQLFKPSQHEWLIVSKLCDLQNLGAHIQSRLNESDVVHGNLESR